MTDVRFELATNHACPVDDALFVSPFRTAVRFWVQTTQISSRLSPKRDCGSKGVKVLVRWATAGKD